MTNHPSSNSALRELRSPARNDFFYGKMMSEFHFRMEQTYFNHKRWLGNRLSLGTGVLCGLDIALTIDATRIRVGPGVAVDAFGREIIVPSESPPVDPRQPTDDCGQPDGDPIAGAGAVTLCLVYMECESDPVPVLVAECDVRESCRPSTIRERYRLQVLNGLPNPPGLISDEQCAAVFPDDPGDDFDRRTTACETFSDACAIPDNDCVVLATIVLNEDGTIGEIDTCAFRPVLYSNAMLFDMILCLAERLDECCGPTAIRSLEIVSGNNQSADISQPVAEPLVVQVSEDGNPLANEPVTFEVVAGDGRVGDDPSALDLTFTTNSAADGRAQLPIWQLGAAPGANRVQASIAAGTPASVEFDATGNEVETELPVVRAIWPPNAANLNPNSENEIERRWFEQFFNGPRLEITFNHTMNPAQLDDPFPWLRLWRLRNFGQNEIEIQLIEIRHAGEEADPVLGERGSTHAYRIGLSQDDMVRSRFVVMILAESDSILDDTPQTLLLDADFHGSRLTLAQRRLIWNIDQFGTPQTVEDAIWNALRTTATTPTLPQSGNGTEGGMLDLWFRVLQDEE